MNNTKKNSLLSRRNKSYYVVNQAVKNATSAFAKAAQYSNLKITNSNPKFA